MSDDPRWGSEPTRPIPSPTGWAEPTRQLCQPWQSEDRYTDPAPQPPPAPMAPYQAPVPPGYYQGYPVAQPPEKQSSLGWVSLGLSVVALVLSVVAGVVTIDSWTGTDLEVADEAAIASLLKVSLGGLIAQVAATLLGLAGLITGAISLANRTSRLVGAFGLSLAIAAPMISSAVLTGMLPLG